MIKVFFNYAFRPFFLLNALFATIAAIVWVLALYGMGPPTLPVNIVYWHAHEMLIGFAMAAVAGFILTAVATWTDRPPVSGPLLIVLVAFWVVGRVAMGLGSYLSVLTVASLDMLFPLLLIVLVAREVIGAGNKRNYPIVFITCVMALLNALYHAGTGAFLPLWLEMDRIALYLLIHLLLLLITVVGGRIIPNFTANWLRARGVEKLPVNSDRLDRATIVATLLTGLYAAVVPASIYTGMLALLAAVLHGYRLSRWCGLATRREPLLFVLHVAYLWLPVGYLLTAMAAFSNWVPHASALHALTMGGIGSMILAVTTRVSLAHTGRPLHAARLTVVAYLVLQIAILLRLSSPFGSVYLAQIALATLAWVVAFLLFLWVYSPVLTQPKVSAQD